MKQLNNQLSYNAIVKKAFIKVLKELQIMLSALPQEELRYTLTRKDKPKAAGYIVHEFLTPLLYLRLECSNNDNFNIHFGVEQVQGFNELSELTSKFIRLLYDYTSKQNTALDIENCVSTDWLLNSCSDAYAHIEERNRYHEFKLLPHKVSSAKRKQLLSVA